MPKGRLGNAGLNAAIIVLGVVLVVLAWPLLARWFGGGDAVAEDADRHDIVQLEVRNGCGVSGLAGRMRDYLAGEGLDVLDAGDWTRFDVPQTVVLNHTGDPAPARAVLAVLGLDEARTRQEIRSDYYLDVTLVIGCDYAALPPFRDAE